MKKLVALAALTLALGSAQAAAKTIVDIAAGDPQFSTLVTALKAAGLVETLSGKGPFTVFAPTNAAFAKIPKADLEKLLKDKAALTKVLTYHVVAGRVTAAQVMKMKMTKTVEGSELNVMVMGKTVEVGGAKVIKANIRASNGIIHVIDTVLMPK